MKKLSMFGIVSIIFIFALSACGIDPTKKFNGRWEASYIAVLGRTFSYNDDNRIFEFNLKKDGTYTVSNGDESDSGNYYIDDEGNAIITFNDDENVSVSVDGNSMIWTFVDEDGLQVYLERVSISS